MQHWFFPTKAQKSHKNFATFLCVKDFQRLRRSQGGAIEFSDYLRLCRSTFAVMSNRLEVIRVASPTIWSSELVRSWWYK
jgi:hypothetical protein